MKPINTFRELIISFVNLLFYGNFWIAACGIAMFWQTEFIMAGRISASNLAGFVFGSTLFIYAGHRVVGMEKVKAFADKGRYAVISTFKNHIWIYTGIGALLSAYFFWQLDWRMRGLILLPGVLSVGYILPAFGGKKRLRDFNFIKIFLVAFVWAWVTVALPWFNLEKAITGNFFLLFAERFLFVFAITIPFDIRDLKVDEHTKVVTIPKSIGTKRSIQLALGMLALMLLISAYFFAVGFYSLPTFLAMVLSFLITGWLVFISDRYDHDYFFTGAIDGMMLMQPILVFVSNFLTGP